MKIICLPLKLRSSRLDKKLLMPFQGRPLFWYALDNALDSTADEVFVVGDDAALFNSLKEYKPRRDGRSWSKFIHVDYANNGTHRVIKALKKLDGSFSDAQVISLQADEPTIASWAIDSLFDYLETSKVISTLATDCRYEDIKNPDVVKVVFNYAGEALYFSRSPIPWGMDYEVKAYTHLGIYGFPGSLLPMLDSCQPAFESENLEQLAWLYAGYDIRVKVEPNLKDAIHINSSHDVHRFQQYLASVTKVSS